MNNLTRLRMLAAKNTAAIPHSRVTRRDYGRARSTYGAPPSAIPEPEPWFKKDEGPWPSLWSPPARTVLKWYMLTGCVCCGVIVGNYYFPATGPMWKEMTALSDELQKLQDESKKLRAIVETYEAKEPLRVLVSTGETAKEVQ